MGDINIDSYNQGDAGYNKLLHFCDVYNLSNLIKGKTCFTKNHKSSIDVILTNRPRYFQHTVYFESGLSYYHLMISTSLKAHLIGLKPKIVTYRSYNNFNELNFLADVQKANFGCGNEDANDKYDNLLLKRTTTSKNNATKLKPNFPLHNISI